MTATTDNFNREDLRSRLTPEQYRITQQKGTEPAFSGMFSPMGRSPAGIDIASTPRHWISRRQKSVLPMMQCLPPEIHNACGCP